MPDAKVRPGEVWNILLGEQGGMFAPAMQLLLMIPVEASDNAVNLINRATTIGPLIDPTNYLDGKVFDNAREYVDLLYAASKLRALLEKHRLAMEGGE